MKFCLYRKHCACFLTWMFYREGLLAPLPTPKLEDHPLSAVHGCLFNLFAATLHIGGRSSIRNLRTRHAVVTGTHYTVKNTTHINIILLNIPDRYDLPNSSAVNKTISLLNRKLYKLVKTFPHVRFLESLNERNLFTNHGLHRNIQGKNLINNQLVQLLFTIF